MKREGPTAEGFVLNVYKEVSWTSHDAVGKLRQILKIRRIGHAGSLDPLANGVLVAGVGRATKLLPYLMDLPKSYAGTLVLGKRTSTGDLGGEVLEEGPVPEVDLVAAQTAADRFLGIYNQTPPMVSALKRGGQRLYSLARRGIEVEREPRPVRIDGFRIIDVELPRIDFEVDCGKGTYVRTLAEDLAAEFGALATVESLSRTAVGPFRIEDSCRLISPPGSKAEGLRERSISMRDALTHLPAVQIDPRWVHRVRQGGVPPRSGFEFAGHPEPDTPVRLLGPENELLALGRFELHPGPAETPNDDACSLKLERVL